MCLFKMKMIKIFFYMNNRDNIGIIIVGILVFFFIVIVIVIGVIYKSKFNMIFFDDMFVK